MEGIIVQANYANTSIPSPKYSIIFLMTPKNQPLDSGGTYRVSKKTGPTQIVKMT